MKKIIQDIFNAWNKPENFSGVFSASVPDGVIFQQACGYRNKAEKLPNVTDTAFAIASGTKFFTALSVCKLIDEGRLKLNDRVWDLLPYDLKFISKDITVFHLLTHTSGMGDYIDEEASADYNDILKLYDNRPVHKWDSLKFYLPMLNELPPKFKPGERVGYSNAGFILLGLVIESASKQVYHQYVKENIILPLELSRTGFYKMNNLPENTALGYIYDEEIQDHITNILYMPIIGGSDGGIFTCAADLVKLWQAVVSDKIFSSDMREQFFTPYGRFGLGVYLREENNRKVYYTVGRDFGVGFFSAYFPRTGIVASALGNTEMNTYPLLERLFEALE
jgi:CubicO group peptidase (beta-lactamase class C family)